jgi:hypothetical protein
VRVAVVHEALSLICDPDSPKLRGKNSAPEDWRGYFVTYPVTRAAYLP